MIPSIVLVLVWFLPFSFFQAIGRGWGVHQGLGVDIGIAAKMNADKVVNFLVVV